MRNDGNIDKTVLSPKFRHRRKKAGRSIAKSKSASAKRYSIDAILRRAAAHGINDTKELWTYGVACMEEARQSEKHNLIPLFIVALTRIAELEHACGGTVKIGAPKWILHDVVNAQLVQTRHG